MLYNKRIFPHFSFHSIVCYNRLNFCQLLGRRQKCQGQRVLKTWSIVIDPGRIAWHSILRARLCVKNNEIEMLEWTTVASKVYHEAISSDVALQKYDEEGARGKHIKMLLTSARAQGRRHAFWNRRSIFRLQPRSCTSRGAISMDALSPACREQKNWMHSSSKSADQARTKLTQFSSGKEISMELAARPAWARRKA